MISEKNIEKIESEILKTLEIKTSTFIGEARRCCELLVLAVLKSDYPEAIDIITKKEKREITLGSVLHHLKDKLPRGLYQKLHSIRKYGNRYLHLEEIVSPTDIITIKLIFLDTVEKYYTEYLDRHIPKSIAKYFLKQGKKGEKYRPKTKSLRTILNELNTDIPDCLYELEKNKPQLGRTLIRTISYAYAYIFLIEENEIPQSVIFEKKNKYQKYPNFNFREAKEYLKNKKYITSITYEHLDILVSDTFRVKNAKEKKIELPRTLEPAFKGFITNVYKKYWEIYAPQIGFLLGLENDNSFISNDEEHKIREEVEKRLAKEREGIEAAQERIKNEKRLADARKKALVKEREGIEAAQERIKNEKRLADARKKALTKEREEIEAVQERIKNGKRLADARKKALAKEREEIEAALEHIKNEKELANTQKLLIEKEREEIKAERKRIEEEKELANAQRLFIAKEREEIEAERKRINDEKELANAQRLLIAKEREEIEAERQRIEDEKELANIQKLFLAKQKEEIEAELKRIEAEKELANAQTELNKPSIGKLIRKDNNKEYVLELGDNNFGRLIPTEESRSMKYRIKDDTKEVSRNHFTIIVEKRENTFYHFIRDNDSTNGTEINSEPIHPYEKEMIKHDSEITVAGIIDFIFKIY